MPPSGVGGRVKMEFLRAASPRHAPESFGHRGAIFQIQSVREKLCNSFVFRRSFLISETIENFSRTVRPDR